jgi:hypothetical protein
MAARHFQLALAAAAQRLSDVYGDGAGVINAAHDIPYRQILLSAAAADAFIGDDGQVTSTDYGIRVDFDATNWTYVSLGPFEMGPLKLSDFYAAGAGSTLHILAIPF